MPIRRAGIKDLRKNHARHMHNLDIKTDLKKTTKKYLLSVSQKNLAEAQANLKLLFKEIDKAAKRNILHKNTAARRKSNFSRQLATLSTQNPRS